MKHSDLDQLEVALLTEGVPGALRLLNRRTLHRFTGIFRFYGDKLENLYLFDREDADAPRVETAPADATFCSFVRAANGSFVILDSHDDPRVTEHPKREAVASYCGVPIFDADGQLYGTLCHFDLRPLLFGDLDLHFMEAAAPHLATALLRELPHP